MEDKQESWDRYLPYLRSLGCETFRRSTFCRHRSANGSHSSILIDGENLYVNACNGVDAETGQAHWVHNIGREVWRPRSRFHQRVGRIQSRNKV